MRRYYRGGGRVNDAIGTPPEPGDIRDQFETPGEYIDHLLDVIADLKRQLAASQQYSDIVANELAEELTAQPPVTGELTDEQADAALHVWYAGNVPYDADFSEHGEKVRNRNRSRMKSAIRAATREGKG